MIHHLSYPEGESVNDYIAEDQFSVQYYSFDAAVHMVQDLGHNCELFKMDVKSAFRICPVSPNDFDLLGFKFNVKFYFDKCLLFGCSISCSNFQSFCRYAGIFGEKESKHKS